MSVAVSVFTMGTDSKTFITMRKLTDEGNSATLESVIEVTAMMENCSTNDVREAFDKASKLSEVQNALDGFTTQQVRGYTLPESLVNLVDNGRELAERFGGSVQLILDYDDEGEVSIRPRFRGIDGVSSSGGGGTGVRYNYLFDGKPISGPLEAFVLKTFPDSKTAAIFKKYADARAEGKKSRIGTITALNRGESEGDALGISWSIKESSSD